MTEMSKISVLRLSGGGKKLNGARQLFEEIVTSIFLKLTKYFKAEI